MEREIPVSKSGEWVAAVSRVEVTTSRDRVFSAGKRAWIKQKLIFEGYF